MEIKYICKINFPKKGENGSVFSMPSGAEKNRKLNINFFESDETEILFPWFKSLNSRFGLNITHTTAGIVLSDKISEVEDDFAIFSKDKKIEKKLAKKVLTILKEATKNSSSVEISCWYAPEFQHFITVPNDEETRQKIERCEDQKLNCKDWILHEDQVEFLLDAVLSDFNEKFDLHIDLCEEDSISSDKIADCVKVLQSKNAEFESDVEKEAWNALEEALQYAESINMPVYFFF